MFWIFILAQWNSAREVNLGVYFDEPFYLDVTKTALVFYRNINSIIAIEIQLWTFQE